MLLIVVLIFAFSTLPGSWSCPKLCFLCPCIFGETVQGRFNTTYEQFLGIPYAEPPIGVLRFKNPVKYSRQPSQMRPFGERPVCIQRDVFSYNTKISGNEDCLYLNIYRPIIFGNTRLPVLVYFPHGNLMYGSGHARDVSPDTIMQTKKLIVVVVQYRVGLMGFFTTGDHVAPGNLGLKDQSLALRWIAANIVYFNGNPFDVTVFGDGSVQFHLLRKTINFQKAIVSGSYVFSYNRGLGAMTIPKAKKMSEVLHHYFFSRTLSSEVLIANLQQMPVAELVGYRGFLNEEFFFPIRMFGPLIENYDDLEKVNITALSTLAVTDRILYESVEFPKFIRGRSRPLWRNMVHNIPMLFGSSDYYGEQWVAMVQEYLKHMPPMPTDDGLKLFLNLDDTTNFTQIREHYQLENNRIFRIEKSDYDRYVKMFNSRYYNRALVDHIEMYNDKFPNSPKLYLYFLNDRVKTNDAELHHLFPPSFETAFESSLPIISIFEEFISTGVGPGGTPCVIDNQKTDGEFCNLLEVNIIDSGDESSTTKNFEMDAVTFWNSID